MHITDRLPVTLQVNGRQLTAQAVPGATLLDVLRDDLHLTGTKEGCREGECGACTVLVDGRPLDSCLVAVHTLGGHAVTTVEGLAGPTNLSDVQRAIVDAGGVQCGFCTPGIVVTLTALTAEIPHPTADDVRRALAGNICRCTGYAQIVEAIVRITAVDDEPAHDEPADGARGEIRA
jgi:carbon-monoxide dehydrogenase small subunit